MMLFVTRIERSSSPLRPLLTMKTMSNARSASITVTTTITMLIGRSAGKTTVRNACHSLAPSMAAASRREGSTAFSPAR